MYPATENTPKPTRLTEGREVIQERGSSDRHERCNRPPMPKATGFVIVALPLLTACMSSVELAAASAPWVVNHTITITGPSESEIGGQCLGAPLVGNSQGDMACVVIEASQDPSGQTSCDGPGLMPVPASDHAAVDAVKADHQTVDPALWNNFCEMVELPGSPSDPASAKHVCENLADQLLPPEVAGWCYVDPAANPPLGDASVVEHCPQTAQRLVRFVGHAYPQSGTTSLIIVCAPD